MLTEKSVGRMAIRGSFTERHLAPVHVCAIGRYRLRVRIELTRQTVPRGVAARSWNGLGVLNGVTFHAVPFQ
jgi:hypothetical protein